MIAELECVVLGGETDRPDGRWARGEDWATVHTPAGQVFCFQRVPEYRPPLWPGPAQPQQFHLDFAVPDLDRAHEQVVALGATLLDEGDGCRSWRVFADPAGHPFCLVRH